MTTRPDDADRALLDAVRGGQPGAFREVFDRHAPSVWRFARDLLGRDDALADEATQETFVRAHRILRGADPVQSLRPLLFGVARNVSRELLRGRRRTVPQADPVGDDVACPLGDPESSLLAREADALLGGALDALPDERREALLLRVDHGLSYDEIAEALGWSVTRVRNEVHRARLHLRAALAPHLPPRLESAR